MNRQKDPDRQTASLSIRHIQSQPPNKLFRPEPPFSDMNIPGKEREREFSPSYTETDSIDEWNRVLSVRDWSDPATLQLLAALREEPPEISILREYFHPTRFSIRGFLRTKCPFLGSLYGTWIETGSVLAVAKTLLLCMRVGFRHVCEGTYYFLKIDIFRRINIFNKEPIL